MSKTNMRGKTPYYIAKNDEIRNILKWKWKQNKTKTKQTVLSKQITMKNENQLYIYHKSY